MRLNDDDQQDDSAESSLQLAKKAYELLCADPDGLHGIIIYAQHSPIQDAFKKALVSFFSPLQLPANTGFTELYGGLDSTATLNRGELVKHKGLLERSEKNGLIVSSVQNIPAYISSILCSAIDTGKSDTGKSDTGKSDTGKSDTSISDSNTGDTIEGLHLNRAQHCPKVIIGIDDSLAQEPGIHASGLSERLALHIQIPDLSVLGMMGDKLSDSKTSIDHIESLFNAKPHVPLKINPSTVILTDKTLKEFTCLALQLGVSSMQPLLNTCRVARTLAALEERTVVTEEDALCAVQLAMAPHAMNLPQEPEQKESVDTQDQDPQNADTDTPDTAPQDALNKSNTGKSNVDESDLDQPDLGQSNAEHDQNTENASDNAMQEKLIAAAHASLPHHLLASLANTQARRADSGRDKQATSISKSGRPIGILRPKGRITEQRINIIETLKVAVPMQGFRRIESSQTVNRKAPRIQLRHDDIRVTRYRQSSRTTTVFVVDASGSSAMHRLAEAKGAVELLLAECYVRRDKVALITFRGTDATMDLPPTRSLTRAKRALQNLPGGGGTPLASGLQLAYRVLLSLSQDGEAPIGVFMTDAKANIALDGSASRENAAYDAEQQSRLLKTTSARLLFVDTAIRKGTQAKKLAQTMGANYLPLPRSGSQGLPEVISGLSR